MKKFITIISLILLIVISILFCNIDKIHGLFQDEELVVNKLQIGNVETEIREDNDTKIIVPGDEFKKTVTVKNIGKSPCYVRVKVLISPEKYIDVINLDINNADWEYYNGFYYYKQVLNQDKETTPLFTKLTIPHDLKTGDCFDVNIYSESIQYIVSDVDSTTSENYTKIFEKITNYG